MSSQKEITGRDAPQWHRVLQDLNEISAWVNRLTPQGAAGVEPLLQRVAQSVARVVPDCLVLLHRYDPVRVPPLAAPAVVAGGDGALPQAPKPGPDGLALKAIREQQWVFSTEHPEVALDDAMVASGYRSAACFPLVVASQPMGVLCVYRRDLWERDALTLLAIESLANHAAMAIYQARRLADVHQELTRAEETVNRLWRAGMLISSRLGLDETLEAILRMALEVTGAHHGIFRLVDESGAQLVTRAVAGTVGRPHLEALPVDASSIMGWVAVHKEPLCIHDLDAAPWVRLYHPLDEDLRMRSEVAVPLIGSRGRLEGVLNLESPEIGAFDEHDRHLLQSLATQAVIAIQEARLLDALFELTRLLLVEPCAQLLQHLVVQATNLLNAPAAGLWTLEGETLVLQAATEGFERGRRLPLHNSLAGQAVLDRTVVTSEDVREDPRFHRRDLARLQGWTRALVVPILSREDGEALGALSVYGVKDEPGAFTESDWDRKVLACLAHYAALALQNEERQEALRLAQERHAVAETFAAVGDVAANVLHHLNNKVGTIPVRVQGIQDKCAATLARDLYLADNLREIERSAREAMASVRDSLSHLRPIVPGPVDVARCATGAIAEAQLPEGVEVVCEGLDALPPVVATDWGLTFIFTNLLENAASAMQGEGTVTLSGQAMGDWVELSVVDEGPGIPPSLGERAFEFGASAAARDGRGLGFGLWWVRTLLMRLGGSVTVEQAQEGGTRFRLRLPGATRHDDPA